MGNLISSEMFKLLKSKALKICTIIGCVLALFGVATFILLSLVLKSDIKTTTVDENTDEVVTTTMADEINEMNDVPGVSDAQKAMFSGEYDGRIIYEFGFVNYDIQILIAIFVAIFVAGEFSSGAIKMMVSRGYTRAQVYYAKLISSIFACTIMTFIVMAVGTIFACIVWGWYNPDAGKLPTIAQFMKFTLIQLLLNTAVISTFVGVAMMFKNLGAVIAISIASYSFGSILFMLLDAVVSKVAQSLKVVSEDIPVMPSELWIFNTINNLSKYSLSTKEVTIGASVAVAYFLLFTLLGLLLFSKHDVK